MNTLRFGTQMSERNLGPVPFDAIDQNLPVSEKLRIPRVPIIVGNVPNPEQFSLDNPQGLIDEAPLKMWYGAIYQQPELLPFYSRGLDGLDNILLSILAILDDYSALEPDIFKKRWHITAKNWPAMPAGLDAEVADFHLDDWSNEHNATIYTVADTMPTEFLVGAFAVEAERYDDRHGDAAAQAYMKQLLAAEAAANPELIWRKAKPFNILRFDESLPHRQPPVNEENFVPRHSLRAIFTDGPPLW